MDSQQKNTGGVIFFHKPKAILKFVKLSHQYLRLNN